MPPMSTTASSMIESLGRELDGVELADVGGEQAAGDAGHERGERERPQLVERDVHARGERGGLALADRRPGAARLAAHVPAARAANMSAATTTV